MPEENSVSSLSSQFSGAGPMRDGLEIDSQAVQEFFTQYVPGFHGKVRITQFKGGQSNPTYRVEAGGKAWVIRRKPPGNLLPSAHAVDREYKVITALGATDVPTPRTDVICMDAGVLGTPFYVMECVEGTVYWEGLLPGKSPDERARIYDSLNDSLARLHSVDYQLLGLSEFGRPGNYVSRQVKRWGGQYYDSEYERIPEMDRLIKWLNERLPEQQSTTVVHGDYRLDNVVFHHREPQVLAILDWELSTLGDPLADFAYHVMQWRIPRKLHRGLAGVDLEELGIPNENSYVEAYCRRTGREAIENWDFYIVFSMFKLAAIFHGILVREKIGTAASKFASETGMSARPLAELAWRQVVEKRLQ